jgi:DNA (cytosine-5)-methyltransferase 1
VTHPLRVAELCAGYGGIGLGLRLAGLPVEVAWWAEIDPHASLAMAAHTSAPNVGDLTELDDPPPADIVTAGWPCQPVSQAGRRKGVDDERWIIEDVCRIAALSGARTLVLENVPGLLTANGGRAMGAVCRAMAGSGFRRWEWGVVRAADVGAPHRRARWFCVAHTAGAGRARPDRDMDSGGWDVPPDGGVVAAYAGSEHPERRGVGRTVASSIQPPRQPDRPRTDPGWDAAGDSCPAAPNPDVERLQSKRLSRVRNRPLGDDLDRRLRERFGGYAPAVAHWAGVLGRPAPDPTDSQGRLSPRFVEWMMGLAAGWVTDVGLGRRQALAVLGNGVVPQQAAVAVADLWVGERWAER